MKRKLKKQLPKANPGGVLKSLLKPRRLKRFFDIKNNPINQVNKSNSIFNNTLAFKESQDIIDRMKGLVNKTDQASQINFMNAAGQLQKLNPKASFHFNSGEANQYKHKFKDEYNMRKGNIRVPVLNDKTGQYTNVGDSPQLAKYMNELYPDMVDVNMTGRMPLNMSKNSAGAPYYSELSENLRQYGDFGMAVQGLQSTDPSSLLDFSISRAPFGKIKSNYSGELGNEHNFLQHHGSPFKIESPLAKDSSFKKGVQTSSGFSGLKMDASLMETDPNFEGTFMKFINKKDIPQYRFDNAAEMKNNKEYNLLENQERGPKYKLDYNISDVFKKRPEFYPKYKQYGGQTPVFSLNDSPDPEYKDGGGTYEQELDKFQNFVQQEEAGWEYVKSKNSSILKPDGKNYYKIFEDNKFYPYYHENDDGTFESEATIGFGKKGKNVFKDYKGGMSLEDAETNQTADINNSLRKTKIFVNDTYGDGAYKKLSDNEKFMLTDFTYNLGRLSKYPSFADAIITGDVDKAILEYIRNDEKGGTPLARNKSYLKQYLQPWIDSTNKANKEEQERLLNENNIRNTLLENINPIDNTYVAPPIMKDGGSADLVQAKGGKEFLKSVIKKYSPKGKQNLKISEQISRMLDNVRPTLVNQNINPIFGTNNNNNKKDFFLSTGSIMNSLENEAFNKQSEIFKGNIPLTRVVSTKGLKFDNGKLFSKTDPNTNLTNNLSAFSRSQVPTGVGLNRNTTHWSYGHIGNPNHGGGSWGGKSTAIINDFENLKTSGFALDFDPTDTYYYSKGNFEIPKNSLILTRDKKLYNRVKKETDIKNIKLFENTNNEDFEVIVNKYGTRGGQGRYTTATRDMRNPVDIAGQFNAGEGVMIFRDHLIKNFNAGIEPAAYKNLDLYKPVKFQGRDDNFVNPFTGNKYEGITALHPKFDFTMRDIGTPFGGGHSRTHAGDPLSTIEELSVRPSRIDDIDLIANDFDDFILLPKSLQVNEMNKLLSTASNKIDAQAIQKAIAMRNGFSTFDDMSKSITPKEKLEFKKDGGATDFIKQEEYSYYQSLLTKANGDKEKIDKINKKYPQYSKMNYGDSFSLARASAEARLGTTNFQWNGNNYTIEEGDDDITKTRTSEQLKSIAKLIEQTPMSGAIANKKLNTKEDYYKYLEEYYKDDSEKSRVLRDIKKNNPSDYLEAFDFANDNESFNTLRNLQNEQVGISTMNSFGGVQNGYMSNEGWVPASENTSSPFINTIEPSNNQFTQNSNLNKKEDEFLRSDYFNKGTEEYNNFSKTYDSNKVNEFKENFATNNFGFKGEELEAFLNYTPNQNLDGPSNINDNPMYNELYKAMNNQMNIQGVVANSNIGNFEPGQANWEDKDRRMQLMNNSAKLIDPSYNVMENRQKTWWEDNVGDAWNTLGNKMGSSKNDALNFIGKDLIHGTANWLGDTGMAAAGVRPYEAGQRFMQNPSGETALGVGIDIASFLGPAARTIGQGFKKAKFINQGLKNTTGFKNNISRGFNLDRDYDALQKINKNLRPNTNPISGLQFKSVIGNRTIGPKFGNNKFGFNSPFTGDNYIFNKSDVLFK